MKLSKIRMLYKAAEAGANDDYVHEKLYENGDFHADEVEAKLKDEELDDLDREAIRKAYQCGFYYGNSREAVRQCVADVIGKKDKKETLKDAAPVAPVDVVTRLKTASKLSEFGKSLVAFHEKNGYLTPRQKFFAEKELERVA